MKDRFLWGSSTAAYQCEGAWNVDGKGPSNWDDFSHNSPMNFNHVDADVACDFYHHYIEDLDMMKESGQNVFRFSIAWTRIIPDGLGEVNQKGIDFYNNVIDACLERGITPFVTIWHYDFPMPLYEMGGFANREVIKHFVRYCKVLFDAFGDRVPFWATLNEPEYYAYCAYVVGNWPPHVKDIKRYPEVGYNLLLASAMVINEFRKGNYVGKIGIVHASGNVEVEGGNDKYPETFRKADLLENKWVTDTVIKGYFPDDLFGYLEESGIDLSFVKEEDKPIFESGTVDFLGVNLYCRAYVKPYTDGETGARVNNTGDASGGTNSSIIKGWYETAEDPNVERDQWGKEIYPQCMYDELMDLKKHYGDFPVYVTENGQPLYDVVENGEINDDERIRVVDAFLKELLRAKKDGSNVLGYMMWTTMDLYSWVNGTKKRWGLVYVDYDNDCKRIPKKSFYWYRDFIKKYQEEYENE